MIIIYHIEDRQPLPAYQPRCDASSNNQACAFLAWAGGPTEHRCLPEHRIPAPFTTALPAPPKPSHPTWRCYLLPATRRCVLIHLPRYLPLPPTLPPGRNRRLAGGNTTLPVRPRGLLPRLLRTHTRTAPIHTPRPHTHHLPTHIPPHFTFTTHTPYHPHLHIGCGWLPVWLHNVAGLFWWR